MSQPVERGTFRRSCRRCGWENTYATKGQADYRKRKHRCEARLVKQQRSEAYAARIAQIDRTPRPCLHKQADHQHGTNAAYVLDKCRCYPCSEARVEADRQRTRQQAYGRYDRYVDAEQAREHVRSLGEQGMGLKRIVAVSDLSQGMLWKLLYGKKKSDGTRTPSVRILRTTHERIMAVELDLADGAMIDGAETARRIQALVASGWSMSKIALRLGIHPGNFTELAHGRRRVTVETAKAVHVLYAELVNVEPPRAGHRDKIAYSRARNFAREHGWQEPLRVGGRAWVGTRPGRADLGAIDTSIEDFDMDEAAIERRMDGDRTVRLRKGEAAELVRRWQLSGRSLAECERLTGVNPHRYQEGAA